MAKIESASRVVCDAGPLIHLHELGCLDLLAEFAEVLIPTAVWSEVALHQPRALKAADVSLLKSETTDILPSELVLCHS